MSLSIKSMTTPLILQGNYQKICSCSFSYCLYLGIPKLKDLLLQESTVLGIIYHANQDLLHWIYSSVSICIRMPTIQKCANFNVKTLTSRISIGTPLIRKWILNQKQCRLCGCVWISIYSNWPGTPQGFWIYEVQPPSERKVNHQNIVPKCLISIEYATKLRALRTCL